MVLPEQLEIIRARVMLSGVDATGFGGDLKVFGVGPQGGALGEAAATQTALAHIQPSPGTWAGAWVGPNYLLPTSTRYIEYTADSLTKIGNYWCFLIPRLSSLHSSLSPPNPDNQSSPHATATPLLFRS